MFSQIRLYLGYSHQGLNEQCGVCLCIPWRNAMSDAERVGEGEEESSQGSTSSTDTLESEPEDETKQGSKRAVQDTAAAHGKDTAFASGAKEGEEESYTGPVEESLPSEQRTSIRQAMGQNIQEGRSGGPSSILESMEPTLQYLSDRLIDVQENQKMLNYTLVEEWEALGGPYRQKVDYGKMILSMLRRPTSKASTSSSDTAVATASSGGSEEQTQSNQRSASYSHPSTPQKEASPGKEEQHKTDYPGKNIPDHPTARRLYELKQLFAQIPEYEAKLQQIKKRAAQIDAMVAKKSVETRRLKEITKQRVAEEYDKKKQDEELDQQLAAAVIDRSQADGSETEK
eukprot:gb/GECG01005238.1/.p1 GENE.gb/GECG01005238.1/~~gb/GECG01005238.1/.p1  ORF type:complete len:343 (+),score=75.18 gb/GECG01005238.1/:1-1029(+)